MASPKPCQTSQTQEAYEILSDRATRRQYDRARFDEARAKSQARAASQIYRFGGFWSAKNLLNCGLCFAGDELLLLLAEDEQ